MTTARDLASRIGVSVASVTQALARSGSKVAAPTVPVPVGRAERVALSRWPALSHICADVSFGRCGTISP